MNKTAIRAGVAGAGVFGGYHARKYADLADTALSAIYDPVPGAGDRLAAIHGATAFTDIEAFLRAVDIVTIAAPVSAHGALGEAALRAGKPVYMEKPVADTVAAAERLVTLAEERGLPFAVGHQERAVFNSFWPPCSPADFMGQRAEFARLGPPSGRSEETGVVLDLMVHDIDIALQLGMGTPLHVAASGSAHICAASVAFDSGGTAHFLASRRADSQRRAMRVDGHTQDAQQWTFHLDFCTREAQWQGQSVVPRLQINDPLGLSVHTFVKAVQHRGSVLVSGRDGLTALKLAIKIEEARQSLISG